MKTVFGLATLLCCSAAYSIVPFNLCADKTKTDCEVLHMPSIGQIDSASGHATATCGKGCPGGASVKAVSAVTLLIPKAADLDYSHYITYEANPNNIVYIQPEEDKNNFERIVAEQKDNLLTLKYCSFSSDNLAATIEKYKKEHKGVQVGQSIISLENYNNLKTAFNAQQDDDLCSDLK